MVNLAICEEIKSVRDIFLNTILLGSVNVSVATLHRNQKHL